MWLRAGGLAAHARASPGGRKTSWGGGLNDMKQKGHERKWNGSSERRHSCMIDVGSLRQRGTSTRPARGGAHRLGAMRLAVVGWLGWRRLATPATSARRPPRSLHPDGGGGRLDRGNARAQRTTCTHTRRGQCSDLISSFRAVRVPPLSGVSSPRARVRSSWGRRRRRRALC